MEGNYILKNIINWFPDFRHLSKIWLIDLRILRVQYFSRLTIAVKFLDAWADFVKKKKKLLAGARQR